MIELLAPLYVEKNEDIEKMVADYREMPVQLTFHGRGYFKKLDHEKLKSALANNGIAVKSIHFPSIGLTDKRFLDTLLYLNDFYGQTLFTVHPQREEPEKAVKRLEELAEEISSRGITLAFENFPEGAKKWVRTPEEISRIRYAFAGLTFDTSHADSYPEITDQLISCFPRTRVVHLSDNVLEKDIFDRTNLIAGHLPVGFGNLPMQDILEFLQACYDGQVVLDYSDEFLDELKEHMKTLPEKLDRNKMKTKVSAGKKVFYNERGCALREEFCSKDGDLHSIARFPVELGWKEFHWHNGMFIATRSFDDWKYYDHNEFGDRIGEGYRFAGD